MAIKLLRGPDLTPRKGFMKFPECMPCMHCHFRRQRALGI
jgi:hypothetical protein